MQEIREIDASTALLAVIGYPIHHSNSPTIYNTAFQEDGLNKVYLAFEAEKADTVPVIRALKKIGVEGINCTMPCKEEAMKEVDRLAPQARYVQGINTLVREGKEWVGYNTDGQGFWHNAKVNGISLTGKKAAIFGTGSTARSILAQAPLEGIRDIRVIGRQLSRPLKMKEVIRRIQEDYPDTHICLVDLNSPDLKSTIQAADLVVQATSLGMSKTRDQSILPDSDWLKPSAACLEVIYEVPVTRFMTQAQKRGCKVLGGIGMLVYQAAVNYQLFTGRDMPVEPVFDQIAKKTRYSD